MSLKLKIAILTLALIGFVAGCENSENSVNSIMETDTMSPLNYSPDKLEFNAQLYPFKITFDGREETSDATTFTWTLHNPGMAPASRTFMIQLPDCAAEPLSFMPDDGTVIHSNTDPINSGVQWILSTETDDQEDRQYSITFSGSVPLGEVYASLNTGDATDVTVVPGPCQGFEIAGYVFTDANNDGLLNPLEEAGIANVLVELIDNMGNIQTVVTDQFGKYDFRKLDGTFTLRLVTEGQPEFFNDRLGESFEATTSLIREVTVPPGSPDNNFGFNTSPRDIIVDLFNGTLPTDGQTLSYWREQFRTAVFDDQEVRSYNGKTLLEMVTEINVLFLKSTYSFTPGQELLEAYEILVVEDDSPYNLLLAELLATELNHTVGRGLVDQAELQLVLISWGEALLAQDQSDPETNVILVNPDDIIHGSRLYGLINTGGGGGIDE